MNFKGKTKEIARTQVTQRGPKIATFDKSNVTIQSFVRSTVGTMLLFRKSAPQHKFAKKHGTNLYQTFQSFTVNNQLLKITILNLNSSVLLAQQGNIYHYPIPTNDLLSFNSFNLT